MSGKQWSSRYGGWICGCQALTLPYIEADMIAHGVVQTQLDFAQLCYNSGVVASAGTHDGGGAADGRQYSATCRSVWKKWGCLAFYRYPPTFPYHNHVLWVGCPHLAWLAKQQVTGALSGGWNGLGAYHSDHRVRSGSSARYGEWDRVPADTWQQALAKHKPVPPPPTPPPKGILGMTKALYSASKTPQNLVKGKAQWVKLKDGNTSFVYGQTVLSLATITVQASGLKGSEVIHLAWQLVYAKTGEPDIIRSTRRIGLTLTAAMPRGQLTWTGAVPKSDKSGYEVRLRAVATTNAAAAKLDYALAEGAEA
jgi:hypothetical protein